MDVGTASSTSSQPREVVDGVWWMAECLVLALSGEVTHLHNSPYLIIGSEKTLLWDTGQPQQWDSIERSVHEVLAGRTLDYIVPSHPEVAHCGNTQRWLEKYPQAQLVGDLHDYRHFFPQFTDRMISKGRGEQIDLGSHSFTFVDAVLKDLPSTQWGYESSQQVLFVGDGFAYSHQPPLENDDHPTHAPGECTLLASELGGSPSEDQVVWITKAALYWTHFVKLDVFRPALDQLLTQYPARLVAPAHGAIIDDVDGILWPIWDALSLSYDPTRGVKLAGADLHEADKGD